MVQYTKKAIEDTFIEMVKKQSLDHITVKDLVETCGVNRNTFYYHYQDIYDLIESIFSREKERVLGKDYSGFSYKEALTSVIELLLNNRDAFHNIYFSKGKDIIERYLQDLGDEFVGRYIRSRAEGKHLSDPAMHVVVACYSEAFRGIMARWLNATGGMDKERFVELLALLTEATIEDAINAVKEVDFE